MRGGGVVTIDTMMVVPFAIIPVGAGDIVTFAPDEVVNTEDGNAVIGIPVEFKGIVIPVTTVDSNESPVTKGAALALSGATEEPTNATVVLSLCVPVPIGKVVFIEDASEVAADTAATVGSVGHSAVELSSKTFPGVGGEPVTFDGVPIGSVLEFDCDILVVPIDGVIALAGIVKPVTLIIEVRGSGIAEVSVTTTVVSFGAMVGDNDGSAVAIVSFDIAEPVTGLPGRLLGSLIVGIENVGNAGLEPHDGATVGALSLFVPVIGIVVGMVVPAPVNTVPMGNNVVIASVANVPMTVVNPLSAVVGLAVFEMFVSVIVGDIEQFCGKKVMLSRTANPPWKSPSSEVKFEAVMKT